MKRLYHEIVEEHLTADRQMIFLAGPRQVGKTTIAEITDDWLYFNWDIKEDREEILREPKTLSKGLFLAKARERKPIVVFDEIHKYSNWKFYFKRFFRFKQKQCEYPSNW